MSAGPSSFNSAPYPRLRSTFIDRRLAPPPPPSSTHSGSSLFDVGREWDENLNQLHLLIDVVFLPVLGKWLGRKTAYWVYTRYQRFGLGLFQHIF